MHSKNLRSSRPEDPIMITQDVYIYKQSEIRYKKHQTL